MPIVAAASSLPPFNLKRTTASTVSPFVRLLVLTLCTAALLSAHGAAPGVAFTCDNATLDAYNESATSDSSLFLQSWVDASCNSTINCLVEYCSCVNGTVSFTCAPYAANASTVSSCLADRAACILHAGLREYEQSNNSAQCAAWTRSFEDAYYAFYVAPEISQDESHLISSCLIDSCVLARSGMPETSAESLNFSRVCNFSSLAVPRNLTTPAPIVLPSRNSTSNDTAVQFRLSGGHWATVLSKNRTQLTTLLQTQIALATNTTDPLSVEIVRMYLGSLVVVFRIAGQQQNSASSALVATMLRDSFNLTAVNGFYQTSANVTELIAMGNISVVDAYDDRERGTINCNVACLIGSTIGGFGGVVLLCILFLIVLHCCRVNNESRSTADKQREGDKDGIRAVHADDDDVPSMSNERSPSAGPSTTGNITGAAAAAPPPFFLDPSHDPSSTPQQQQQQQQHPLFHLEAASAAAAGGGAGQGTQRRLHRTNRDGLRRFHDE